MVTLPSALPQPKVSGALQGVVILLVLSVSINYIDRGNLSIAAPLIKDELGISASQLGILLSSFFWTYAAFQIPCGWLVDRFEVNWVLAVGFFLWSVATAATGLIHGFAMLLALRLLLGIGESVAYPCYSKIMASHFLEHQRGLPNALIDAGTKVGPALGTLVGGILMAHFGWRPFFIALGLGSLFWLPGWVKWMPRGPGIAEGHPSGIPSIPDILFQLFLVLPAHLAALLSGSGAALLDEPDGYHRLARLPCDRHLDHHNRMALRPLHRRRRHAHARPQDLHGSGVGRSHHHRGGGLGFQPRGIHGLPDAGLHVVRRIRIQPLGHHADHRGTSRRRPMVGFAELRGEPGRSHGTRHHRIRGGQNRRVLLGLRRFRLRGPGWLYGVPVSAGAGRAGGLARAKCVAPAVLPPVGLLCHAERFVWI